MIYISRGTFLNPWYPQLLLPSPSIVHLDSMVAVPSTTAAGLSRRRSRRYGGAPVAVDVIEPLSMLGLFGIEIIG